MIVVRVIHQDTFAGLGGQIGRGGPTPGAPTHTTDNRGLIIRVGRGCGRRHLIVVESGGRLGVLFAQKGWGGQVSCHKFKRVWVEERDFLFRMCVVDGVDKMIVRCRKPEATRTRAVSVVGIFLSPVG